LLKEEPVTLHRYSTVLALVLTFAAFNAARVYAQPSAESAAPAVQAPAPSSDDDDAKFRPVEPDFVTINLPTTLPLPAHAINVAIPLIDVAVETGPTGIWLGSHKWPESYIPPPEAMTSVPFQRGDCILVDYRTLHTGLPNHSNLVRPIIYMTYARTWFFDECNRAFGGQLHFLGNNAATRSRA